MMVEQDSDLQHIPVSVVSPHFCAPHTLELNFAKNIWKIDTGNFAVNDADGNLVFTVKGSPFGWRDRRVILDSAHRPILSLKRKFWTRHDRWQVFRGESAEEAKDMIFSAKTSHTIFPSRTKLHVFSANNTSEHVDNYTMTGRWSKKSYAVCAGSDSSVILAQMHRVASGPTIFTGKEQFAVKVYPNIDYAFVVALFVILDAINTPDYMVTSF